MSRSPVDYGSKGSDEDSGSSLFNVYCRLKPLKGNTDGSVSIVNNTTVTVSSPLPSTCKQTYFIFKHVFPPTSTQKEIFQEVAYKHVEHVLNGQNALLFTYGNTGSGKTFTMKGTMNDGGIVPRSLDAIFNSISSKLVRKNLFKSDKANGFEILSENEAASETNKAHLKQIGATKRTKAQLTKKAASSDPDLAERFIDPTHIVMINNRNSFSVFISFVEIYNNNTYDLLEDRFEEKRFTKPQVKLIREDSKKRMYTHGVTEVEVSSTEEAYEEFYRGLKKRHVAHTLLNANSSRSHSVFTIRVVQADLNDLFHRGSSIPITIGQLSLVDLAGSERTNRTQNTGKVLKEAGNINNSLMCLRQCFDAIRENQRGGSKIIPYRYSKLTTLFKSFFEGDGYMSMIICINPSVDDYDENLQVLKFADYTQDVHLAMPVNKQIELEDANRDVRLLEHFQRVDQQIDSVVQSVERKRLLTNHKNGDQLENIYFPPIDNSDDVCNVPEDFLSRIVPICQSNLSSQTFSSRLNMNSLEKKVTEAFRNAGREHLLNHDLKLSLKQEKEKRMAAELQNNCLKRKLEEVTKCEKKLKRELKEKEDAVVKTKAEVDREKEKLMQKRTVYKEKYNSELEKRLRRQRTELEMEIQSKDSKLARVQRVLSDEVLSSGSTPSVASYRAKFEKIGTPMSVARTPRQIRSEIRPTARNPNVAVSNRRHRRSKSAGEVWVEHKPAMPVPLNTVLQPTMAKRRSITKLTDAKQVTQGASKYCLMTQTQDSDGDLETRLYKGDVIPTSGGGAQVLFNDVEVLKQISPDASPKRAPREEVIDPQPSCSYAIEGHNLRSRRI